ncbi:hypothetical protein QNO09_09930 [Streptomyces sp. 378]|nr:hypothetical protein [Streptomyces sp. 378]MDK1343621.1 hypothetical protein [Streptomyces sp. 378]
MSSAGAVAESAPSVGSSASRVTGRTRGRHGPRRHPRDPQLLGLADRVLELSDGVAVEE